jgi:hypothetical protein
MEDGLANPRIQFMQSLSNSKVAWLLTLLCAVPIGYAATDGSAGSAIPKRADQIAHQSGQARKLLSNPGGTAFENTLERPDQRRLNGSVYKAPGNEVASTSEPDAVHAALANLTWQSRDRALQDAARHFHQEGLPLTHLWQSNSSSVSIGINPERKPGLWFVKRFP